MQKPPPPRQQHTPACAQLQAIPDPSHEQPVQQPRPPAIRIIPRPSESSPGHPGPARSRLVEPRWKRPSKRPNLSKTAETAETADSLLDGPGFHPKWRTASAISAVFGGFGRSDHRMPPSPGRRIALKPRPGAVACQSPRRRHRPPGLRMRDGSAPSRSAQRCVRRAQRCISCLFIVLRDGSAPPRDPPSPPRHGSFRRSSRALVSDPGRDRRCAQPFDRLEPWGWPAPSSFQSEQGRAGCFAVRLEPPL